MMLNQYVSLFVILLTAMMTSTVQAESLGTFKVLSIDHSNGTHGQYFNFNIRQVNKILGSTDWHNKNLHVRNNETGEASKAVLWSASNGGSVGNGHGRWDDGTASPFQWRIGDTITILIKGSFDILSVDHQNGTYGQYFNFSVDTVDKILGNIEWDNKDVNVLNSRTGKISKAVLWRKSNGGSIGNGHGRWNDGTAEPKQWRKGDRVIILL
jgi:hypothetical protein